MNSNEIIYSRLLLLLSLHHLLLSTLGHHHIEPAMKISSAGFNSTFRHIIRQPFPAKTFPTSELVVPEIIKIGENWLYNCTVSLTNHRMSDRSNRFLLLLHIFSHNHDNGNNKLQPQSLDQTSAIISRPNFSHHCQCNGAYQYSPGKTIN